MVGLFVCCCLVRCFYVKQKTAYEMRISDWSSDVCSSDLQLVLRTQVEIRGIVALVKLVRRIAHRAIDHPPAFHCRARGNLVGPALDMLVILHLQKFTRVIDKPLGECAVPGPDRHFGNGVIGAGESVTLSKPRTEKGRVG